MSRRHSRQRSSVSVKKRSSLIQDRTDEDIHDNTLSTIDSVASNSLHDGLTLGSPYPDSHPGDGRMESQYSEFDDEAGWEQRSGHLVDDVTTRTELDLFDDEDEKRSISTTSSQAAPAVPEKEAPSPVSKEVSTSARDIPLAAASRQPILSTNNAKTPSRQNSYSGRSSTPTNIVGGRRLSLLAGGSILGPHSVLSPMESPSGSRTATPKAGPIRSSSPTRKAQPVKRMSLSYIPSPVIKKSFNGVFSNMNHDPPTPSATGTPPLSSTNGYFGRFNGSVPGTPSLAATPSIAEESSISSSPIQVRGMQREDGDTVMTQHMDILSRIAEKERRILDVKELLAKEEEELRQLQTEWQKTVNLEMIGSRQAGAEVKPSGPSADIRRRDERAGSSEADTNTTTANVASEGWKAISARLAGAGNQLNALIDQLAAPSTEEEGKAIEGGKARASLEVLQEEAEEGDAGNEGKDGLPPLPPSANKTPNSKSKRSSILGTSMAALQKQMELQFGPVEGVKQEDKKQDVGSQSFPSSGESGGWGSWQKRLKEARENASGLLAKAEAKLGQALTIDDMVNVNSSESSSANNGKGLNRSDSRSPNSATFDFMGENDREKAALAELSWLNSLAGINMSGTTDRVTTSRSPEVRNRKSLSNDESQDSMPSSNNKRASSSSRASQRASSNSQMSTSKTSSSSATTTGPTSPSNSSTNEERASKADSNGFFSILGNTWGAEGHSTADDASTDNSLPSHTRQGSSGGQSKTRMAAKMALQDRSSNGRKSTDSSTNLPPAQDSNADDEKAWGW